MLQLFFAELGLSMYSPVSREKFFFRETGSNTQKARVVQASCGLCSKRLRCELCYELSVRTPCVNC